ncbi:MAG: hypothetical protein AAGG51_23385 [Cyanobacteria bacterium P01_G01_bin.54]
MTTTNPSQSAPLPNPRSANPGNVEPVASDDEDWLRFKAIADRPIPVKPEPQRRQIVNPDTPRQSLPDRFALQ